MACLCRSGAVVIAVGLLAIRLLAGILGVVIAGIVAVALFGLDKPFDSRKGVGVQAGWDQLGLQLPGLSSPAVAGAFGIVQAGVGGQGVKFVPGQVVADRQPPRRVRVVAALRQRIGVARWWPGQRAAGPGPSAQQRGRRSGRGGRRW